MKAIVLPGFDQPPGLRDDLPEPTPGAADVLVRIQATSVNPVDSAIAAGILNGMFEHEFPVVLGRDYAGVVDQVGAGVAGYAPGDEVYGYVPHADPAVHDGSWAELIAVPAGRTARRPVGLDVAAAGVAPLTGITALMAVDALELGGGDTVLIVGATGGVGSFAVQLSARADARVLAPALPEDEQYLRDLGATELLPRDGDVGAAARERVPDGVDALLDLVSYAPGAFDAALNAGARVASPNAAAGEGPGRTNVLASPTPEILERLAGLLDDGTLRVPIQRTFALDQAAEALEALTGTHTQGKLAVRVA